MSSEFLTLRLIAKSLLLEKKVETFSEGLKAARWFRNYYHKCANQGMALQEMSDKLEKLLADPEDWWKFAEEHET